MARTVNTIYKYKLRELLAVGALLLAILVVFFSTPLLGGRILGASDAILTTRFFAELSNAPREPSNPLLFDQTYQFVPWRYFAWRSLHQGE